MITLKSLHLSVRKTNRKRKKKISLAVPVYHLPTLPYGVENYYAKKEIMYTY